MSLERFGQKENIKEVNQEIRNEIKKTYAEFQSFYSEILSRAATNPGITTEAHDARRLIDHLASEMAQVQRYMDTYPEQMPTEEVSRILVLVQKVMNKAQGFYHGEYNLLDKNGLWLDKPEHVRESN